MKKKQKIHLDRQEFINWTQGICLDRTMNSAIIVDEVLCERAYRELKKGNTIILMVSNVPYSSVRLNRKNKKVDEFIENLLK